MDVHTNTQEKPVKRLSFSTLGVSALVCVGLSACGSGSVSSSGNGSSSGSAASRPADLRSTDAVATQIGTLGSLFDALNQLSPGVSATPSVRSAAIPAQRSTEDCPDGGQIETFDPENRNVNSPYTDSEISVTDVENRNCRYLQSNSQDGNQIDTELVINGRSTSGDTTDVTNGDIQYVEVGIGSPLMFNYDLTSSGSADGQSFQSESDLSFDISLRADSRNSSTNGAEVQYRYSFDGNYTVTSTANGQSGSAQGNFNAFVGNSTTPMVVSRDTAGLFSIEGDYGFGISPAPQGLSCNGGTVTVSTSTRLMENTGNGSSPWSAGVLELSAGGNSASVQFNSDSTITITTADGMETLDYSTAIANASPCTGFAFAGFAFAASSGAFSGQ